MYKYIYMYIRTKHQQVLMKCLYIYALEYKGTWIQSSSTMIGNIYEHIYIYIWIYIYVYVYVHIHICIYTYRLMIQLSTGQSVFKEYTYWKSTVCEGAMSVSIPLEPTSCRILMASWNSVSDTPVSVDECKELPWYRKHCAARWCTEPTKDIPPAACQLQSIRMRDTWVTSSHSYSFLACTDSADLMTKHL